MVAKKINVAQLMIDTSDIVKELANLTANHSHHNTETPLNTDAIKGTVSQIAYKKVSARYWLRYPTEKIKLILLALKYRAFMQALHIQQTQPYQLSFFCSIV
ncbi:TPA: hypothetical protein ACS70H_000271 [Providencia alcalifaciens]